MECNSIQYQGNDGSCCETYLTKPTSKNQSENSGWYGKGMYYYEKNRQKQAKKGIK